MPVFAKCRPKPDASRLPNPVMPCPHSCGEFRRVPIAAPVTDCAATRPFTSRFTDDFFCVADGAEAHKSSAANAAEAVLDTLHFTRLRYCTGDTIAFMAKFKPVRAKTKAMPRPQGAIGCVVLVILLMIGVGIFLYLVMTSHAS
jgi:hypothetical protein